VNCECTYCRRLARKIADDLSDTTVDEVLRQYRTPKTPSGARVVPLLFEEDRDTVQEYFRRFGEMGISYSTLLRRVKKTAQYTDGVDAADIGCQTLCSTAATFWARRGLDNHGTEFLRYLMGWAKRKTADTYVKTSGRGTAAALDESVDCAVDNPGTVPDRTRTGVNAMRRALDVGDEVVRKAGRVSPETAAEYAGEQHLEAALRELGLAVDPHDLPDADSGTGGL